VTEISGQSWKETVFLKLVSFRFAFRIFTPVLFEGFVLFQDRLACHITAFRYRGYLMGMSHNVLKNAWTKPLLLGLQLFHAFRFRHVFHNICRFPQIVSSICCPLMFTVFNVSVQVFHTFFIYLLKYSLWKISSYIKINFFQWPFVLFQWC